MVKPPYSSKYSIYENLANHAIITIVGGAEPIRAIIYGTLTNDQTDLRIQTRQGYLGGSFQLGAGETKVLINDMQSMQFLEETMWTIGLFLKKDGQTYCKQISFLKANGNYAYRFTW